MSKGDKVKEEPLDNFDTSNEAILEPLEDLSATQQRVQWGYQ